MVQAHGQNPTCNSLQYTHFTGAAGIPVPHLGDNLHSVWGHRGRTGCGACILMDAWWVPLIQQDVSREGSRVLAEANHSPMAVHHDPAPAEEMQTLSEPSHCKQVLYLHRQEFNPSFRFVFLSCLSQQPSLLGARLGR